MRPVAAGSGWQQAGERLAAAGQRTAGALWALLLEERDRWMLWTPVLVGLGAAVYFLLPQEPHVLLSVVLVSGAAVGLAAGARADGGHSARQGLAAAALLIATGFAAGQVRTGMQDSRMLAAPLGPVEVIGQVAEVERFPASVRVTLESVAIAGVAEASTPRRLRLRLKGEQPVVVPGERIAVRAMLSPPPGPGLPGAYDFQRQAFFDGLGAVGYSIGPVEQIEDNGAAASGAWEAASLWFAGLRAQVSARVHATLAEPEASVTLALLTGETQGIPPATMDAIRASGLAHLLSISGLHIGLVAGIVFVTARSLLALIPWFALRWPTKKLAAILSVTAAAFYTLLAGAPVPAQRSFLMVAIALLAVLVDRQGISMRLIAWAALAVLLTQPDSLTGPSFQMSFAAVVALVATYEVVRARRERHPGERRTMYRILLYPAGIILSTLVASVATTPFAAYHFDRFQLYGIVANLIAVPVTSFWIMPCAVPAMLLMPLGAEGPLLQALAWGVSVVVWIAGVVASWPGAVVLLPPMPAASLALITLGGLWLCLWRRRWRLLGLVGIACGAALMLHARSPDLLVDGGGRLVAVRGTAGDLLFSGRTPRSVRERWLQRDAGSKIGGYFPVTGTSADGSLRCDVQGCIFMRNSRRVAIARSSDALADDCRLADLVISLEPVSGTCAPTDERRRSRSPGAAAASASGRHRQTTKSARDRMTRDPAPAVAAPPAALPGQASAGQLDTASLTRPDTASLTRPDTASLTRPDTASLTRPDTASLTRKTGATLLSEPNKVAVAAFGIEPVTQPPAAAGVPAVLIDAAALARNGTHAVWLDPDAIRIVTVAGQRGERPWTMAGALSPAADDAAELRANGAVPSADAEQAVSPLASVAGSAGEATIAAEAAAESQ